MKKWTGSAGSAVPSDMCRCRCSRSATGGERDKEDMSCGSSDQIISSSRGLHAESYYERAIRHEHGSSNNSNQGNRLPVHSLPSAEQSITRCLFRCIFFPSGPPFLRVHGLSDRPDVSRNPVPRTGELVNHVVNQPLFPFAACHYDGQRTQEHDSLCVNQ